MTARQPYHPLRVAEVITETADAVSVVLDVPSELDPEFAYRPGQFLTLRIPRAAGGPVARCYSLASTPQLDSRLKITVKRVADGHASNWICDRVRPGDVLEVLPPAGLFTTDDLDADLLLLAGGSGITPVISILKATLAKGSGHIALVYANRDAESVIFAAELRELEARHPERLEVRHWFDVDQGPPTVAAMTPLLLPYADRDTFICGPEPFLAVVRQALGELAVPSARVHVERFKSLLDDPADPAAAQPADADVASAPAADPRAAVDGPEQVTTAEVMLDGQTHRLPWPAGTLLLDLLIEAGLNPPYSCRQGICGACACRVVTGEVELVHNEVLEDEDFAEGYTLACQARPIGDRVTITYQ